MKNLKFRGWYNAAFRLGQETRQILFEFQFHIPQGKDKKDKKTLPQQKHGLQKLLHFFWEDIAIRIFGKPKALNFENSLLLYCSILIMRFNWQRQAFPWQLWTLTIILPQEKSVLLRYHWRKASGCWHGSNAEKRLIKFRAMLYSICNLYQNFTFYANGKYICS